ncbi:PVC-type heme-binding CxxCH protein [Anatilimnocola sp. NA78]|uniref:PVC-type heme-binding CxxCH protein n=1 Tax=Anatilimnocola sp. NA78 TaxID=3415683 RepID=UPI003CE59C66
MSLLIPAAQITVPEGFSVEIAAAAPLVQHPIMAGFDDRGRLFVAENAGLNLKREELEKELPNSIVLLSDTDDDGQFDKRTVFADKLTFPQGALWHEGWLYVASSGGIWRFRDTDGDDVADKRELIVGKFGYTGNAADVHGCFLGPEGRIYWCEGRHGHEITNAAGELVSKGKAARIFSCEPDGGDVRTHCGGGMDNPTEVDWTAAGEMLGTVNILYHQRGDCLVHWLHGGVYPRHDQPAMLAEFRRTGEPLDAVYDFGHVAVSGLCRFRSCGEGGAGFGRAWNDAWFVTEFNTHKVKSVQLTREGSSFRAEARDFFTSTSGDSHPTDVLQDADGSLLVIDTGGWFRIGCPTSQIAKPDVLGSIYRVRKTGATKIADPWGKKIQWERTTADELIAYLGDNRPAFRSRAVVQLVRNKDASVPYLAKAIESKTEFTHQQAAEALTKIGSPAALSVLRAAVESDDSVVQQLAMLGLGAHADEQAVDVLAAVLSENQSPELQLAAATALGKIGESAAVPEILEALSRNIDRPLEHALIYALIEIDDADETREALAHASPLVRRAGLIALDQMPSGNLQREEVAALLTTGDLALQTASLDVLSRHPGWTDELVASLGKLFAQPELNEQQRALVIHSLVAFRQQPAVQALLAEQLTAEPTTKATRLLLLEAIAEARYEKLSAPLEQALRRSLIKNDPAIALAAIRAVGSAPAAFAPELRQLASAANTPDELRLAALAIVSAGAPLAMAEFTWLDSHLDEKTLPAQRLMAARVLGAAKLTPEQQQQLTSRLSSCGPLELIALLAAFERPGDEALGDALAQAILSSPVRTSLALPQLDALLKHYPASTREAIQPLLEELAKAGEKQRAQLEELVKNLPPGNAKTGKQVFLHRQAGCALCHRIGPDGGRVGPDLSTIGQRRNARDLLEAIAFPSSSLARGYESHSFLLVDGRSLTGLVVRETADALIVRAADQSELRIARGSIEEQKPSSVSIMPAGLDKVLSRQQLADLVAYLQTLK